MSNTAAPLFASKFAITTASSLCKKSVEKNNELIDCLESLVFAEKLELQRLLAERDAGAQVRYGLVSHSPVPGLPASPFCTVSSSSRPTEPISPQSLSPSLASPYCKDYFMTTVGNMSSKAGFDCTSSGIYTPATSVVSTDPSERTHKGGMGETEALEMAARGSHWSFAEKQRFETALSRFGPFAWDPIIRAVGSRTEKQVKAYAARYRRRKKLAASMNKLMAPQAGADSSSGKVCSIAAHPALSTVNFAVSTQPNTAGSGGVLLSERKCCTSSPIVSYREGFVGGIENGQSEAHAVLGREEYEVIPENNLLEKSLVCVTDSGRTQGSEGPSEVDLLVDRAISGEILVTDETPRSSFMERGQSVSPDFLGTLFTS